MLLTKISSVGQVYNIVDEEEIFKILLGIMEKGDWEAKWNLN